jgi:glycosyltransferase involved in cell wall biosynthesis
MKILLVSSFLPYPLTSGGNVRLFNLLKRISRHNQITLVCEKRSYQTQEDERMVLQFCNRLITVPRRKQWSVGNILKTGFSSFPFLLVGHTNYRMREIIKDLLSNEKFDLVHIETSYVMQNLPDIGLPTLLVEHNIEYLVYKRFAKNAPVFLKPFLYLDVAKLRFWEQRFWKKATRVAVVSEIEREVVEDVIGRRVFVIPNGVDTKEFSFSRRDLEEKWGKGEKRVLFVGNFS